MDSTKRIILGLTVGMLGILLSGCKSSQTKNSSSERQASSLKEENSLLKENSRLTAKEQELETKNSSSSTIENKNEVSSNSTNSSSINSPNDAIALAKSRYGDNNGDWHWECLSSNGKYLMDGQYYFVKAISQEEIQNGSMTGTVKSLKVYPDGAIEEN